MLDLSHIFPVWYLDPPTMEDLKKEVQRLLYDCVSSETVLHYIRLKECPYHQEALAEYTKYSWHQLEREEKEPAAYRDSEGNLYYSWRDIDLSMRPIIRRAHELQIELERESKSEYIEEQTEVSSTELPMQSQAERPISASTQIAKADVVYCNCTFYGAAPEVPLQQKMASEVPTNQPELIAYPSFFRTNAQSITAIQKKWEEAMTQRAKTKCIRYLLEHSRKDGYFDFSGMTNEERAEALNKAQKKYNFTKEDFENANKPRKKITAN